MTNLLQFVVECWWTAMERFKNFAGGVIILISKTN
jgi:hypothetical protein